MTPDLFAIIRYDDAPKAMDWLERAFSFRRELVVPADNGSIDFALMRLGNDYIGTGSTRPGLRQAIGVYLPDVDAHCERVRTAGGRIIKEPNDNENIGRNFSVEDPGGHHWSFATFRPDKPPGCDIFPIPGYPDERAAIAFLKDVLGFEERMLVEGADGSIAHAELGFGHGVVMPATSRSESDNPWASVDFGLYVCLDDVDAHYATAKAAGAEIVREINDTDYGAREYSVRDIEGRLWSFGTYRPAGSRP